MNQSIEFLHTIDSVWNREIPAPVMERARKSLLDYLAVTCAGAEFQKEKLEKYWHYMKGMRRENQSRVSIFRQISRVFNHVFGFFLGGATEDDIVETVITGRPEGVRFYENALWTERLDGRQFEADFEMAPLLDPRIAAEKRFAVDLQVVTFA